MPISKLRPAFTFTEDRLRELQAVVPEAFADGKINWDTLREALGEALEDETKEHFGLFWPGKREARGLAALPSKGTLIPQPGAGVDEENTHNLFIEGDNLEVLKLLQKSYAGRVKMIYIDPPYNTGNDFLYPDDYSEPLDAYLQRTGQTDEEGQLLTTNSRAGGRFHSNWLNMMYPRLRLARELLSDDGVIFINIDDNEVNHLSILMNEIFGEENFIATLPWKGRGGRQASTHLAAIHEFVLLFAKEKQFFVAGGMSRENDNYPEYDTKKKRNYKKQLARKWGSASTREARPNLYYSVIGPDGSKVFPKLPGGQDGRWRWGRQRMEEASKNGILEFVKQANEWILYEKIYEPAEGEEKTQKFTTWLDDVGSTANGTDDLRKVFSGDTPFDYPKPISLIQRLIQIANVEGNSIILDFFAGSCTTAQAVLDMNINDGNNRKFIMVQLPEPTENGKYKTIAEIGKERIRRVIKSLKLENKKQSQLLGKLDFGLKVLELENSNFVEWQTFTGKDTSQLELRLEQAETPLVDGWQPGNLLSEILLLQGFPLDSKVHSLPEFKANDVQQVTSEFAGHHLYICLDKKVKAETVAKINLRPEDILVCLDSALSDEAKVKLADQCNLKVI